MLNTNKINTSMNDYIVSFNKELHLINYSDNTIKVYLNIVSRFLEYFKKSPKNIFESDIKDYVLKYDCSNTKAQQICALKLFYTKVVRQPLKFKYIDYPRKESKLPEILSIEEIQLLFNVITNLKHKSIVSLLYSCGLRVSEVINLKLSDIDSKRMIINIRQSKGNKDRIVPLNNSVLELLYKYYFEAKVKPKEYLFNGQFDIQYSETSIRQFLNKYQKQANIKKNIHPHIFRHSFSVHHLENGTDIRYIQELLGHSNSKTTERYLHVSNLNISKLKSPIENIKI